VDLPFRIQRADLKETGVAIIVSSSNEAEHFTYYREQKKENQNFSKPFLNRL